MRILFFIVLSIVFLGNVDHSVGQGSKAKNSAGTQQSDKPAAKANMQDMFARNAAIAQGKDPDKIKLPSSDKTASPSKKLLGFSPKNNGAAAGAFIGGAKRQTTEEKKESAKKQYTEIFSPDKTYEVRLRNKALALRKGKFMGMANRNTLAVFESKRQIVAVPADKLHRTLAGKVEAQIEKAVAVFKETGVAFDDVFEIPDSGDQKTVGLAGRERIQMYLFNKPKVDPSKKSEKPSKKDDAKSDETKADPGK